MKKISWLVIVIFPLLIFGILVLKNQNTNPQKSTAANSASVLSAVNVDNQSLQIDNLTYSWFFINKIDSLKLIPNFNEKISSKEVIANNNCQFLSNASFYSQDNKPLGLFITNGNTLANFQTNSLFDGILSINDMATPRITRDIPQDHLNIAIQTGPIIKENNTFQTLQIQNDTESRRVIAAVTGGNKLYFVVIYDTESEYLGPMLSDLPGALKNFELKANISFADAINLDGGAASTFNSPSIKLSEINPVGAFFCQP